MQDRDWQLRIQAAMTVAARFGHLLGAFRVLKCEHGHTWASAYCSRCGASCIVAASGNFSHGSGNARSVLDGRCDTAKRKKFRGN